MLMLINRYYVIHHHHQQQQFWTQENVQSPSQIFVVILQTRRVV